MFWHLYSKSKIINVCNLIFVGAGRSLTSAATTKNLLIRTKEERHSPGPDEAPPKTTRLDAEDQYDITRLENRHELVVDERGLPSEWSYEEQFKKVCLYFILFFVNLCPCVHRRRTNAYIYLICY